MDIKELLKRYEELNFDDMEDSTGIKIQESKKQTKAKHEDFDLLNHDDKFRYMMLDRMRSDCDYFLGNGNGYEKHLWSGSVEKQIENMKALWNSFVEKPEWLSMEDIEQYEKDMLAKKQEKQVTAKELNAQYEALNEVSDELKQRVYDKRKEQADKAQAKLNRTVALTKATKTITINLASTEVNTSEFSYEEGEILHGASWDGLEDITAVVFTTDDLKEAINKAADIYNDIGITEYRQYSKTLICTSLINENNDKPSDKELEQFKAGEINLYIVDIFTKIEFENPEDEQIFINILKKDKVNIQESINEISYELADDVNTKRQVDALQTAVNYVKAKGTDEEDDARDIAKTAKEKAKKNNILFDKWKKAKAKTEAVGYDNYGPKEMLNKQEGTFMIQYNGGAGSIERLYSAGCGRLVWKNIVNGDSFEQNGKTYNVYTTDYDNALDLVDRFGGEIVPLEESVVATYKDNDTHEIRRENNKYNVVSHVNKTPTIREGVQCLSSAINAMNRLHPNAKQVKESKINEISDELKDKVTAKRLNDLMDAQKASYEADKKYQKCLDNTEENPSDENIAKDAKAAKDAAKKTKDRIEKAKKYTKNLKLRK